MSKGKIDKIATWPRLSLVFFLLPLTFWEARDQPESGFFFPRSLWGGEMKAPGNEVEFGDTLPEWE